MKRRNTFVLAGDYKDCWITSRGSYNGRDNIYCVLTDPNRELANAFSKNKFLYLSEFMKISKETIEHWELATEDSVKSFSSSLVRGLVGGALLGPIGLIAGGLSGKNNKTYHVMVQFKDGKKSLFELGDLWYKDFLKVMF